MPNKSKEINPFDGGLNNYHNARDIEDNELASAINLDVRKKGQISISHAYTGSSSVDYNFNTKKDKGLFVFTRDYTLADPPVEDPTELFVFVRTRNLNLASLVVTNNWADSNSTELFNFGNTGGLYSVEPSYYILDGNLRMGDGSFQTPQRFYGVIKKQELHASNPTIYAINEANTIGRPLENGGRVYFTNTTAFDETSNTNGYSSSADAEGVVNFKLTGISSATSEILQFESGQTNSIADLDSAQTGGANEVLPTTLSSANSPTKSSTHATSQYGISSSFQKRTTGNSYSDYLYSANGNDSNDVFLAVASQKTQADHEVILKLASSISFTNKSVFLSLWVPSGGLNSLASIGYKIRIGTSIPATSTGNAYVFDIASATFTAETWTQIECSYGSHSSIEGAPNPNHINKISIETIATGTSQAHRDNDWGFNFAVDQIKLGDPATGTWTGKYKFYYGWVYDYTQHSETRELGNQSSPITLDRNELEITAYAKASAGGWKKMADSYANDDTHRITGANLYFSEVDDAGRLKNSDKKHLMELHFENGVRENVTDDWEPWNESATNFGHKAPTITSNSPSVIDTFLTIAGYTERDKVKYINHNSATVMNRTAYIGNVSIRQNNNKDIIYTDRIYKSVKNQPDIFTDNSFLEVAANDGESITALANYGDFLMEFKETCMYLINVTQDIEYLEEKYAFRGVWADTAIVNVASGVCWVNKYGCFLFNGKEVIDLTEKKIDKADWNSIMDEKPKIGYKPLENQIHVFGSGSSRIMVFDFINQNWVKLAGGTTSEGNALPGGYPTYHSNIQTKKDGTIIFIKNNGADSTLPFVFGADTRYMEIITKDDALEDPSRNKSLKKCYLTYKINDATNVPTITYRTSGNSTDKAFHTPLVNTSGEFSTIELKPNVRSEATNHTSFQIVIKGLTHHTFEVNDINLVYREKYIK